MPQHFRAEIGLATGVIGAMGGVGGFFLPTLLGNVRQVSGSFAAGFAVLAFVAAGAGLVLKVSHAGRVGPVAHADTSVPASPERDAA